MTLFTALRALLLVAVAVPLTAQEAPAPALGTWRAWLEGPGGELPFGLELERTDAGLGATLVNGSERIAIPAVRLAAGRLVLDIDHYDATLEAAVEEGGATLRGTWRKRRGPTRTAELPFVARHGAAPRFPGERSDPTPVVGRWAIDFGSDELPSVGIFEAGPDRTVRGTILTATGDYRYLAGALFGNELALSCFDGAHAFLFRARITDAGSLVGDFWSADTWHETWTAARDPDAALPDPFAQTSWSARASLADLVFPDLAGRPRSLAEPELLGEVTLVQLFGSWCPNCHDETAYLVELDERYRARGLRIIGVAFEVTGDFERDVRQLETFRARYGVEYPLLLAGLSDKAAATRAFGALDRVRSFPTTLFFDREAKLRRVHSGFVGPAAGAAHEELAAEFEREIETLLAEPVREDPTLWQTLLFRPHVPQFGDVASPWTFQDGVQGRAAGRMLREPGTALVTMQLEPVQLIGDIVWVGSGDDARVYRLDLVARVLCAPTDIGARLAPLPLARSPLLERAGFEGEAGQVRALAAPDATIRREAVLALARRRARSGKGLPEALKLLAAEEVDVVAAALFALGHCAEPTAAQALAPFFAHANPTLRREAARAAGRLVPAHPELTAALRSLAHDPHPLVARAARVALDDVPGAADPAPPGPGR